MLEDIRTSLNINDAPALADAGAGHLHGMQRTESRVRVAQPLLLTREYAYFGGIFDAIELSPENSILGSIEAQKMQHYGDVLREMIAQYSGKVQSLQFPQLNIEPTFITYEPGIGGVLGSSLRAGKNMYSTRRASEILKFRQEHFVKWQLNLVHASWYDQACKDLQGVSIEAAEEGFEAPEPSTFEHTRNMLRMLSEEYDELPDIQPMEDRSIAICFENRDRDSSILFVVESDRAGFLIARINGVSSQRHVSDVLKVLPSGGYHAMDEAGIRRIQGPDFDF